MLVTISYFFNLVPRGSDSFAQHQVSLTFLNAPCKRTQHYGQQLPTMLRPVCTGALYIQTSGPAYQICKQLCSIPSKNECVSSWPTNFAVSAFSYILNILIFLVSMKSPFKLLDLPIKRSRKEELLQGRVCTNVRATQNFLGSFSWSKGKTTSRRRNETGTRILWIWIWILP